MFVGCGEIYDILHMQHVNREIGWRDNIKNNKSSSQVTWIFFPRFEIYVLRKIIVAEIIFICYYHNIMLVHIAQYEYIIIIKYMFVFLTCNVVISSNTDVHLYNTSMRHLEIIKQWLLGIGR